jgi:ParB family chromosome partitioning protein
MARKNLLTRLTDPKLTAVNFSEDSSSSSPKAPLAFTARGAVGSVSRSIDELAARADRAKALEARLAAGSVIVDIDPALIDSSFVVDRMQEDNESFQLLISAIRSNGQESPILVRPHPVENGRYQVAFGHRRLRAAVQLQRPVKAFVKSLSDRDLVIAQGQENSARTDLSFVEKARFALRLEAAGYDRETIMAALSVDKTTVSRMISVTSRIPENVVDVIGPARSVGRDRWLELAALGHTPRFKQVMLYIHSDPEFLAEDSDGRFDLLLRHLTEDARQPVSPGVQPLQGRTETPPAFWARNDGTNIVKIKSGRKSMVLYIDHQLAPGFGDYLLGKMDRLYEGYVSLGLRDGKDEEG